MLVPLSGRHLSGILLLLPHWGDPVAGSSVLLVARLSPGFLPLLRRRLFASPVDLLGTRSGPGLLVSMLTSLLLRSLLVLRHAQWAVYGLEHPQR
jgi:hypothetical protein